MSSQNGTPELSIRATPFGPAADGSPIKLLTPDEQARLQGIGTLLTCERNAALFRQGDRARYVYVIVSGVVKTTRLSRDGAETVTAFHFAEDMVGIAERGYFVNSAEAVQRVEAYAIPISALEGLLRRDAALELHFICKICHELREQQRHTILLSGESPRGRLLLFLSMMLEEMPAELTRDDCIRLPMSRTDIANFIGVTTETVSRTFTKLTEEGILRLPQPRHVEIVDRAALDGAIETGWPGNSACADDRLSPERGE